MSITLANPDPLTDPKGAAQYLGVSRLSIYYLVRENRIRHIRVGSAIRIPQSALDEFIAAGGVDTVQRAS